MGRLSSPSRTRCATLVGYRRSTRDRPAILQFARENGFVVFTHDLDFGNILAATNATGPSVLRVRTQDATAKGIGELVLAVIRQQQAALERGVLITVEPARMRLRMFPLIR